MNFQGFVYFCNEIGVNVSNFSHNAISIVVFQLNLYNHFSPKRDILFNGIRYLFQRLNIFHTSCFYYMEIKGLFKVQEKFRCAYLEYGHHNQYVSD